MWWCGEYVTSRDTTYDVIYNATSTNLVTWTTPVVALRTKRPPQGTHACDPTVVKRDNGVYYLYYTSETGCAPSGCNNQIYLATSTDAKTWAYANSGNAVIPMPPDQINNTYGVGASSVMLQNGIFYHFYANSAANPTNLSTSTDGIHYTVKDIKIPSAYGLDIKYLPQHNQYLYIAGGGQSFNLGLYLLDSNFKILKRIHFPDGTFPYPCNHNPGMLGDSKGTIIDETKAVLFFASGPYASGTDCWNPGSWDIWKMTVDLGPILATGTPGPTSPTPKPITPGDVNKDGFVNYADYLLIKSVFGNPYTIFDYNNLISNYGK